MKAKDKAAELFPVKEKFRTISMIIENDDNVITSQTLEHLRKFEELLYTIKEYDDTTTDDTNKLVRPKKGNTFGW